jgi:GcrA cell cycle regulator
MTGTGGGGRKTGPRFNRRAEWPPDRVDELRRLWDSGLSGAGIGRRIGMSKNAVIGKAHRLDLPARRTANAEPMPPPLGEAVRPVIAAPVRPVAAAATRPERIGPCCWITGERGPGRKWRYCDADSMPRRPYCRAHAVQAWPAIKRGEDSLAHGASVGGEG